MAYFALKKMDFSDEQLKDYSDEYKMMFLREARFEVTGQQVFANLEKSGIPFIPLKGILLKELYPQPSMRSFTDYDIYIANMGDAVKAVMENSGFAVKDRSGHDVTYYKNPSLNFEMHSSLFEGKYTFNGYFDEPFNNAVLKENSKCCHLLNNEYSFIYTFCHLYKHFTLTGCGLRQFMDIYVMTNKLKLDFDYIENEIKKLKLTDFYNTVKRVNAVLFDGNEPDRDILEICEYIFNNGTFGIEMNFLINECDEEIGNFILWKIKYFAKRWGLSFSRMKDRYNFLGKMPFLLPFCYFHKLFRVLIFNRMVLKSQIYDIENYNSKFLAYLNHIREISGIR